MESKLKSGNPCKRFLYLDKDGVPVFKDKVKYKTKAEAQKKADEFNKQDKAIHYAVPYRCPVCVQWHIGRSVVEITQYRKRQLQNNSYTTDSERGLCELREKLNNARKIDLSKYK